jgi:formylglycine-generating enzyme required for sulfatase activity
MRSFDLPPAVFQPIAQDAAELIAAIGDRETKQADRISFAEALGVYGDPRLTDAARWIEIEAGTFKYGMHDELVDTLIAAYALARWPVTIAEYAQFIDEDGYANDDYWKAGRGAEGVEWQRPKNWQAQLRTKASNHPVVGVSWFEAKAYCAWLTASQSKRMYEFDLPTDAQWEAAARGTLTWRDVAGKTAKNPMPDRDFPWVHARDRKGEPEYEQGRANIDSSEVGNTSPVGSFPGDRGPFGHWDLAGNVWEWCGDTSEHEDLAKGKPYWRSKLSAGSSGRVIRGGSFGYVGRHARCSLRNDSHPSHRNGHLGFRPARVSADLLHHFTSGNAKKNALTSRPA